MDDINAAHLSHQVLANANVCFSLMWSLFWQYINTLPAVGSHQTLNSLKVQMSVQKHTNKSIYTEWYGSTQLVSGTRRFSWFCFALQSVLVGFSADRHSEVAWNYLDIIFNTTQTQEQRSMIVHDSWCGCLSQQKRVLLQSSDNEMTPLRDAADNPPRPISGTSTDVLPVVTECIHYTVELDCILYFSF